MRSDSGRADSDLIIVSQSGYPRGMNSSRADAIDSSGLVRKAPAVSWAELSIKIARRWGAPKKFAGPPPPTIPTRNLRWLILSSPGDAVYSGHVTIAQSRGIARGE